VFLLGCLLFTSGLLVGWFMRRSKLRRRFEGERTGAQAEDGVDRPQSPTALEELARQRCEQMAACEWDGGPPRPNWNRRGG